MAYAINLKDYPRFAPEPGLFTGLRQGVADYGEYRVTYDELNALGDRELADFGLARLNIREVAREAVYANQRQPGRGRCELRRLTKHFRSD